MSQDHDHTESERQWRWDHLLEHYKLEQLLEPGNADGRTLYLAERCGLGNDFKLYLQDLKEKHESR